MIVITITCNNSRNNTIIIITITVTLTLTLPITVLLYYFQYYYYQISSSTNRQATVAPSIIEHPCLILQYNRVRATIHQPVLGSSVDVGRGDVIDGGLGERTDHTCLL